MLLKEDLRCLHVVDVTTRHDESCCQLNISSRVDVTSNHSDVIYVLPGSPCRDLPVRGKGFSSEPTPDVQHCCWINKTLSSERNMKTRQNERMFHRPREGSPSNQGLLVRGVGLINQIRGASGIISAQWKAKGQISEKAKEWRQTIRDSSNGSLSKRLACSTKPESSVLSAFKPCLSFHACKSTEEEHHLVVIGLTTIVRLAALVEISTVHSPVLSQLRSLNHYHIVRGVSTSLARGWDSFTCIPASTTKSSTLNALTTALQPFLGFVESGFPFTHNGGAAPTRPGRRPRVIPHSSHNKSTLKLTYPLEKSSECELVGLKGCFPTRLEDSVEMSTAKGMSSGSIEEGGEKKRMMPDLELVESLLVTDVDAFSTLFGVATLGAFGLRKQLSDDVIVHPLFIRHPASGLPTCNWYAIRQVFILCGLEYDLPYVSKKEIFRKIR
ncbi:hypothetical protein TanjilG_19405 [Lupinus angustifolius]|uniref:Uncharacterized protein n=1 Tax=Lupinus angustifolius TaxID=3871 RepID=A0A4P1R4V6_LUPAN|nr:hypothetical protein TanjilG_19405 [Lupinus angustifolius]